MQVHIDRGGQRFGPYTIEQVNTHLAEGSILSSDLGWSDGMTDWLPITQVPGITFVEAAPPPTPSDLPSLPKSPTAENSTCPSCQAPISNGQVVCMGCGTNLQNGQNPALQTTAQSAGNKKLLIGAGAGVGILALAAAGYFVIYPKLSGNEANQESNDIVEGESTAPMNGDPGFGPGMRPPPNGGFAGGQGGPMPQGGFGGQQGGFGGKGRPPQGSGLMRYDKNKDGKISKAEVPQQMAGLFDRLDKNKDSFLDQTEIRSIGAGMGRPQGGGKQGGFGGKGGPQGSGQKGGFGGQGGRPQGGRPQGGRPQGGRPQGGFGGKGQPQGGGPQTGGILLVPGGISGQGQPQPR